MTMPMNSRTFVGPRTCYPVCEILITRHGDSVGFEALPLGIYERGGDVVPHGSAEGDAARKQDRSIRTPNDWTAQGTLTARESEIARLVAKGLTNKQIAATLGISIWTVSTYLRRIYAKIGVHSRAAMVAELASREQGPSEV